MLFSCSLKYRGWKKTMQYQVDKLEKSKSKPKQKLGNIYKKSSFLQQNFSQPEMNHTGIPDNMKTLFENMSGFQLDDVQVHYNSNKPAQLKALAYTQGKQVYLGPGNEKCLSHELVHVVQQKQGIVRKTVEWNGLPINTELQLEHEADQGIFHKCAAEHNSDIVQCSFIDGENFAETLHKQRKIQEGINALTDENAYLTDLEGYSPSSLSLINQIQAPNQNLADKKIFFNNKIAPFTTVGLEHEFATFQSPHLKNVTHVVLARSHETLPYTGLDFSLETDANDKVEFVTPPFLIETGKTPVPFPEAVAKLNTQLEEFLLPLNHELKLRGLVERINAGLGITLDLDPAIYIRAENLEEESQFQTDIEHEEFIDNFSIHPNETIVNPQVNFATDARSYNSMLIETYKIFQTKYNNVCGILRQTGLNSLALAQVSRVLVQIPYQAASEFLEEVKKQKMVGIKIGQTHMLQLDEFIKTYRIYASIVKDFGRVWLKDNFMNYILNVMPDEREREALASYIKKQETIILEAIQIKEEDVKYLAESRMVSHIIKTMNGKNKEYVAAIIFSLKNDTETVYQGARPDTYVDLRDQRRHPAFANQNLHLVEIRSGGENTKTNARALKYYLNRAYNVQD